VVNIGSMGLKIVLNAMWYLCNDYACVYIL